MTTFDETVQKTNRWIYALKLGFFAGLIWGAVKNLFYYLEFTKVKPLFLVKPLFTPAFTESWIGHLLGWGFFIAFSMASALIYTALFSKIKGPWMGMIFGAGMWAALYLIIGPVLGMMNWIYKLDLNTIISDFCLFLLWGLFIGYSVAVEFTEERANEPLKAS
jgi:hypothetical protein